MKLAKIHKVCEGYGVSINGTKFELIERIIRHEIKAKVEENEKKAQMEVMMSLKVTLYWSLYSLIPFLQMK